MKKIIFGLICLLVCFLALDVNAACGAGVSADGEFICLVTGATQANSKGTLYPENGTTLVMNNYNGGNISFSSGLGNPFKPLKIKLIGDNYIKAEDSFGLKVSLTGVEFVGDGTLTITSKAPIVAVDCVGDQSNASVYLSDNVSTVKIASGNSVTESSDDEVVNEEQDDETVAEVEEENSFDWTLLLVAGSCLVSVVCLIIVVVVLLNNRKGKNNN